MTSTIWLGAVMNFAFRSHLNSDPIYFWQQTTEDITVCVRTPEGVTKEAVQFRLTADNVSIGVQGFAPLLQGQLYAAVDPEASTWIFKDNRRFVAIGLSIVVSIHFEVPFHLKARKSILPKYFFKYEVCLQLHTFPPNRSCFHLSIVY